MKKETLKTIIRDFHVSPLPTLNRRSRQIPVDTNKIIMLVGVRRSGKTSLLFNIISDLLQKGIPITTVLYINFEDERLDLKTEELDLLLQAWQELYPEMRIEECSFFFDEIQNIAGWDKFVRRIYDRGTRNIFITGSNARFLSSDIATTLRGRTISFEVFPLSFSEYLAFREVTPDLNSSHSVALINHHLQHYLDRGGFPEVIGYDDALRNRVLQEYFNVMIYRDLVERYEIKNLPALKFFLKRIVSSATKQFSVNKIYNELKSSGFRIGKNQLYDFLEGAVNIYLAQTLRKHSDSLVDRELGEKKVYVIDTGLLNALDFRFSDDTGKALEQAVFLELRRREKEIYFFREKAKCDFIVKQGTVITEAIQVSTTITDTQTRSRELRGLTECCTRFGLQHGVIITLDASEEFKYNGIAVTVTPLYRWLLMP
ncbi:MAG: ATP-binding protein [Chlorobiaceae bacterium]|jgi:predicted AAA+ superfamily ATPase|nr:ATP-binding protein [Chlorobiaceae bacterium]